MTTTTAKPKEIEWRKNGILLALETASGDLIARGILDGEINVNSNSIETPSPGALMLVPCPFVLDCDGINGQFACADQDGLMQSKADAKRRGWRNVRFDPFSLGASYLGTCPQCQKETQAELAIARATAEASHGT